MGTWLQPWHLIVLGILVFLLFGLFGQKTR